MKKNIEITIPILNEELTLKSQVNKIVNYLNSNKSLYYDITLVISDNGSTDNSLNIALELEKKYSEQVRSLL